MRWKLERHEYRKDGIFGNLYSEDGEYTFTTLEHAYPSDGVHAFEAKISEGVHPCILYLSPKHGYEIPLLNAEQDKGHLFEVHIGNYNEDSDGCILVGYSIGHRLTGDKMLTSSKQAFKKLMEVGCEEIEVIDVS
jgi:hypothetical protein